MATTIYDREVFLVGDYIIEVWEGQHPRRHATCWKWRVQHVERGIISRPADGEVCDTQLFGLLKALTSITRHELEARDHEGRGDLVALYPGLELHMTGMKR